MNRSIGVWKALVLALGAVAGACGDSEDDGGGSALPGTEAQIFYGMTVNSCIEYERQGQTQRAVAQVFPPRDPDPFPDRNYIRWELFRGSELLLERLIAFEDGGRVTLLREATGTTMAERVTRFYENGEPLWAIIQRQAGDVLQFAGTRFESSVTPSRVVGATDTPELEQTVWTITNDGADIGLPPPLDMTLTTQMTYILERGDLGPDSATWNFVPEVGFVQFQEFAADYGGTNSTYTYLESRNCDLDGQNCTGTADCVP